MSRVRPRMMMGRTMQGTPSHENTYPARTHPRAPRGVHQAIPSEAGSNDRAKQPTASGDQGPSSHSERADGQVRDAQRVPQEGRDEVCAGVAQHPSRHEPLSGDNQKPPSPGCKGLRGTSAIQGRQAAGVLCNHSRHDADNVVCPSAEHFAPEA